MNSKILKMVILREKLNELCYKDMYNKSVSMFPEILKSSSFFDDDVMDILFASYYLKNRNNQASNIFIKFIENNVDNKKILHDCFVNNKNFAIEISCNYLFMSYENLNIIADYDICNIEQKKIINKLSPYFNYKGLYMINFLARYTIFKYGVENLFEMNSCETDDDYDTLDNDAILNRILLGDAYTYMILNNDMSNFNNYLYVIENCDNDFNKLCKIFNQNVTNLKNFITYASNLFLLDENYSNLYRYISKKNSNFMSTLKFLNPFYILDEIDDYNQKKYFIK